MVTWQASWQGGLRVRLLDLFIDLRKKKHNSKQHTHAIVKTVKNQNLVVSLPGKTCVACLLLFF